MTPEEIEEEFQSINLRLRVSDDRMNNMEKLLQENTAVLKKNTDLTEEIKDILDLGKSFFRILRYVGIVAKWVSGLGVAAGVIWAMAHGTFPGEK